MLGFYLIKIPRVGLKIKDNEMQICMSQSSICFICVLAFIVNLNIASELYATIFIN